MSSAEMADWIAYDRLEPLGPRADREQLAVLTAAFINANMDQKKHKPVNTGDFMPGEDPTPASDRMLGQQAMLSAAGSAWEARQKRD